MRSSAPFCLGGQIIRLEILPVIRSCAACFPSVLVCTTLRTSFSLRKWLYAGWSRQAFPHDPPVFCAVCWGFWWFGGVCAAELLLGHSLLFMHKLGCFFFVHIKPKNLFFNGQIQLMGILWYEQRRREKGELSLLGWRHADWRVWINKADRAPDFISNSVLWLVSCFWHHLFWNEIWYLEFGSFLYVIYFKT